MIVQERYEVLLAAAAALATPTGTGRVFPALLPFLRRALPADAYLGAMYGGNELEVVFRAGAELGGEAFCRRVLDRLRAGEYVIEPDAPEGGSRVAAPLPRGRNLLGVLAAVRTGGAPPFDDDDARLLHALARMAAAPLNGAASILAARRLADELESLGETTRAMGASLDFDAVVQRVADQAQRQVGKPVVVWLVEEGRVRAVARAGGALVRLGEERALPPGMIEQILTRIGPGLEIGDLIDLEHAWRIPSGAVESLLGPVPDVEARRLTVPLVLGRRLLGFLAVGPWSAKEPGDERLRFLLRLAPHAATAIENARLHEELRRVSLTDPLVGLPNRRQLDLFLEREFAAATRGRPLCFMLYDLDHFKAYNDTRGHRAGDDALIRFAEVLRTETRAMNLSARYGGEEFATVLSGANRAGGLAHAERVRRRVQQQFDGRLTVSVGVAEYSPEMHSPGDLISAADRALYRAKQLGRNRVCVAHE